MVDGISMLRQFIIVITKNRCCTWTTIWMHLFAVPNSAFERICHTYAHGCCFHVFCCGQCAQIFRFTSLQWRHNERVGVSNHQPPDWLLNCLFMASKKTSKLRVTGLCAGDSPVAGEFPAQIASNAENVSIWWRHHVTGTRSSNRIHHTNEAILTHIGTGNACANQLRTINNDNKIRYNKTWT